MKGQGENRPICHIILFSTKYTDLRASTHAKQPLLIHQHIFVADHVRRGCIAMFVCKWLQGGDPSTRGPFLCAFHCFWDYLKTFFYCMPLHLFALQDICELVTGRTDGKPKALGFCHIRLAAFSSECLLRGCHGAARIISHHMPVALPSWGDMQVHLPMEVKEQGSKHPSVGWKLA